MNDDRTTHAATLADERGKPLGIAPSTWGGKVYSSEQLAEAQRVLADRIKKTRKLRDLSVDELATLSAFSTDYIQRMQRHEVNISMSKLLTITGILGISAADLVREVEASLAAAPTHAPQTKRLPELFTDDERAEARQSILAQLMPYRATTLTTSEDDGETQSLLNLDVTE